MEHYLDKKTKFDFAQTVTIINLATIAKFFQIICKALFIFLLATGKIEKRLLKLISNYFTAILTNRHKMLQLYYLVLLKIVLYLVILYFQIQDNYEFC